MSVIFVMGLVTSGTISYFNYTIPLSAPAVTVPATVRSWLTTSAPNSSQWLVLNSSLPISVMANSSGVIPEYNTSASLNQTRIGTFCLVLVNDQCSQFQQFMQTGWYWDPGNSILFIHYIGGLIVNITVAVPLSTTPAPVNWSLFRGVAYRSALLDYTCYINSPLCDNPVVSTPDQTFAEYKQAGWNFARVGPMSWRYAELNLSGIEAIWSEVANACDTNGVSCDYHFGANCAIIPADVLGAWGSLTPCSAANPYYSHFVNNSIIPSGIYAGQPAWQALWNGLFKPLVQTVDIHSSTVGYGLWNEPGLPYPWNTTTLHNYYEYMTQQIRIISSKVVLFQANAGGGGGGTIPQLNPTADLAPYVFEIHNYQGVLNYNPYPQVVSDCAKAGCSGILLGEWGFSQVSPISPYTSLTQEVTDELNAVKQNGLGNEWFSWDQLSNKPSATLNSGGATLSQLDNQIFGNISVTSSSSITSSSIVTTTSLTLISSITNLTSTNNTLTTLSITSVTHFSTSKFMFNSTVLGIENNDSCIITNPIVNLSSGFKMTFIANGTSGTKGQFNISVPKSSIPQNTVPVVSINSNPIQFGELQNTTNIFLIFVLHFSTDNVTVNFVPTTTTTTQVQGGGDGNIQSSVTTSYSTTFSIVSSSISVNQTTSQFSDWFNQHRIGLTTLAVVIVIVLTPAFLAVLVTSRQTHRMRKRSRK